MSTQYRKYNFNTSDLRNFLIMLAAEFKKRGKELIPDGLILKHPKEEINGFNNTYIDLIGIPFKKVYGRTRLYYRRIKLSEFADRYRVQLGTTHFPIRLRKSSNPEVMEARIKSEISKRTGVPPEQFIISKLSETNELMTYSFKFRIQETEFSTADSGLSLVNDKPVTIYVAEPNVEIQAGYVKIPLTSIVEQSSINSSSYAFLRPEDLRSVTSLSELYPKDLKLKDPTFTEVIPSPVQNMVYRNSIGAIFEATIPDSVIDIMLKIRLTGDDATIIGNKVKVTVKSGITEYFKFEDATGKEYSELIDYLGSEKEGLFVTDPIDQVSIISSSVNSELKVTEFQIKYNNSVSNVTQNPVLSSFSSSNIETVTRVLKYLKANSDVTQSSIRSSSSISEIKVQE